MRNTGSSFGDYQTPQRKNRTHKNQPSLETVNTPAQSNCREGPVEATHAYQQLYDSRTSLRNQHKSNFHTFEGAKSHDRKQSATACARFESSMQVLEKIISDMGSHRKKRVYI